MNGMNHEESNRRIAETEAEISLKISEFFEPKPDDKGSTYPNYYSTGGWWKSMNYKQIDIGEYERGGWQPRPYTDPEIAMRLLTQTKIRLIGLVRDLDCEKFSCTFAGGEPSRWRDTPADAIAEAILPVIAEIDRRKP